MKGKINGMVDGDEILKMKRGT